VIGGKSRCRGRLDHKEEEVIFRRWERKEDGMLKFEGMWSRGEYAAEDGGWIREEDGNANEDGG